MRQYGTIIFKSHFNIDKVYVQQIVSIGIFEVAVLLNVLFVISPIDANPFDELE